MSTTIEGRAITGLPVNGRSFIDFVLLTPELLRPRVAVPVLRSAPNVLLLADGTDNNNTFFGEALGFGAGHNPGTVSTRCEFQVNKLIFRRI